MRLKIADAMPNIYTGLLRRLIMPLGESIRGSSVLKNLERQKDIQWWPSERIRDLQEHKLRALVDYAYTMVPYYRDLFDQYSVRPTDIQSVDDLSKLPILEKHNVRNNFPGRLVSQEVQALSPIEIHSSGSTGEPLRFYASSHAQDMRLAALFRFWEWADYDFGKRWVRISLWQQTDPVKQIYDRIMRCLYLSAFRVDEEILQEYVEKIKTFRPQIIRGYASAVYILARYIHKNGIDDIHVEAVITTGDNLFDHYRALIESAFHCAVFDTYGGEGMVIGGECKQHTGLHIAADNVIVEFLKNGQPVSPGEIGEIIVTDLNNYAMPFIRYRLGDLGRPSNQKCSCGRGLPLMESIEGRNTDIVVTPNGQYLVVHFFTVLFEHIVGVEQFQVVQEQVNTLLIRIVKNKRFTPEDHRHIIDTIHEAADEELQIKIDFVKDIPLTDSGKRQFVISEIGQDYFSSSGSYAA
jgi:phenylacetate-CoA ligase